MLKLDNANSKEMDHATPHPVIDLMEDQKNITDKGGTMRLGAYDCKVARDSNVYKAYGKELIKERHRHRYEFNNEYLDEFKKYGMVPTGINPDTGLIEIVELPTHRWFVGVQFHPNTTVLFLIHTRCLCPLSRLR